MRSRENAAAVAILAILLFVAFAGLSGCAAPAMVTKTEVIEKPVPVRVKVTIPPECQKTYAVDALQKGADPVQENRAMRAELEQRAACEAKLRAAVEGNE